MRNLTLVAAVAVTTAAPGPAVAQADGITTSDTCTITAYKPGYETLGRVKGTVARTGTCDKGQVTGKLIHLRWGPDEVVASRSESGTTLSWTLRATGYSGHEYISKLYGATGTSVSSPTFTY